MLAAVLFTLWSICVLPDSLFISLCCYVALSDCRTVGLSLGLSDCRTVGLSDCRTCGRQWQTVEERMTTGITVGMAVGLLSDCRTVGLAELSDCRITVGLLSDYCRITVGIHCRTVGPRLRFDTELEIEGGYL